MKPIAVDEVLLCYLLSFDWLSNPVHLWVEALRGAEIVLLSLVRCKPSPSAFDLCTVPICSVKQSVSLEY
jgi:hypothetical protein